MDQVYLLDDDGTLWELDPADVEMDGDGFWLLAAEGEDHEDFYELCDVDCELED